MKFKKEKGFKKIEIEDPEFPKKSFIDIFSTKCLIFLIIAGIFILIFLIFELFLIIANKDNFNLSINNYNLRNEHIIKTMTQNSTNFINPEKKEDAEILKEDENINQNIIQEIDNEGNVFEKEIKKFNYKIKFNYIKGLISIIVIVNINNKEEEIENLLKSIYNQTFSNIEIIIVDDFNKNRNNFINYEKFTQNDKKIKILNPENNIGNFRKRIEGVNISEGEYLIFMDADDSFFPQNNIIEKIYNSTIENNIDILEFKSYHFINCKEWQAIYQPELFDLMYFKVDNFFSLKQFHITGKIIKKELYLFILENIDNFYKEQNMNYYEESMLLFMLFKKANSFELIKMDSTKKLCTQSDSSFNLQDEQMKKDFLLYLKFMLQYSETVPEKRMISSLFIKALVEKHINFNNEESEKLIKDVIYMYLTCEKINEYEQTRVKNYENFILGRP